MSTRSRTENDAAILLTDAQINDLLEIVPLSLSIPKSSALAFQKKRALPSDANSRAFDCVLPNFANSNASRKINTIKV